MAAPAPNPVDLRRRAESLAAGYPALLAEAAAADPDKVKPFGSTAIINPLTRLIKLIGAAQPAAIKSISAKMNGKPPIRFIFGAMALPACSGNPQRSTRQNKTAQLFYLWPSPHS